MSENQAAPSIDELVKIIQDQALEIRYLKTDVEQLGGYSLGGLEHDREMLHERDVRIQELENALRETRPYLFDLPQLEDAQARRIAEERGKPFFAWKDVCIVECKLWVRVDPDSPIEVLEIKPALYYSSGKKAKAELKPAIEALLNRMPDITDLGNQSMPGLESDELLHIIWGLLPFWINNKKQYEIKKNEVFHQLLPRIQEKDSESDTNALRIRFNNVIERTFRKLDNKKKAYRFSKQ